MHIPYLFNSPDLGERKNIFVMSRQENNLEEKKEIQVFFLYKTPQLANEVWRQGIISLD